MHPNSMNNLYLISGISTCNHHHECPYIVIDADISPLALLNNESVAML